MDNKMIAKNMAWNSIGSFLYSLSQWLITIMVIRLSDNYGNAGILSLAMSVTSVFSVIGYYSVRNYQISDIKNKFLDYDYILHRIIFCIFSNMTLIIFLAIMDYDISTKITIFVYMLYRDCEIIIDVFHGILQKFWRMNIIGISFLIRGIFGLLAFCVAEYLWDNLIWAIMAMVAVSLGCMILVDIVNVKKICNIKMKVDIRKIKELTLICFPLFCYSILTNVIVAIPKVRFEQLFGEELLGYYTSVVVPAVIIQAVATYIFNPLIPVFSQYYVKRDKKFLELFIKIIFTILTIGIFGIVLSQSFGRRALSLVFGKEILKYSYLLAPGMVLSITTALAWFAGTLLIVMRNNKCLILGSLAGTLICIVFTAFFVPYLKIDSINFVTMSAMFVEFLIFCVGVVRNEKRIEILESRK